MPSMLLTVGAMRHQHATRANHDRHLILSMLNSTKNTGYFIQRVTFEEYTDISAKLDLEIRSLDSDL